MDKKLCYELVLSEIHEGLCALLDRTRNLNMQYQSPGELDAFVRIAAEIRHELAELERMSVWPVDSALGCSFSDIRRQFLDLEGRLKEQRNDCSSAKGTSTE